MPLWVRISGPAGIVCSVNVDASAVLEDLKTAIEAETGIPAPRQRLLHGLREWCPRDNLTVQGLLTCDGCCCSDVQIDGNDGGAEDDDPWLPDVDLLLIQRSEEQVQQLLELEELDSSSAREWLRLAPEPVKENREMVLAAVAKDGLALLYACPQLKGDSEIVLTAVANNGLALQFAEKPLRADRGIVLAAVSDNGSALEHASLELQADHEIVLTAVTDNGAALEHAGPVLQADREVVLAAVQANAVALRFAGAELRRDPILVRIARQNSWWAPE